MVHFKVKLPDFQIEFLSNTLNSRFNFNHRCYSWGLWFCCGSTAMDTTAVCRWSSTPYSKAAGGGVPALPILEFLSNYAHTLCCRTTKFDVVTHVGEERVPWAQPRLPCQDSEVPALLILGVLYYTYIL